MMNPYGAIIRFAVAICMYMFSLGIVLVLDYVLRYGSSDLQICVLAMLVDWALMKVIYIFFCKSLS